MVFVASSLTSGIADLMTMVACSVASASRGNSRRGGGGCEDHEREYCRRRFDTGATPTRSLESKLLHAPFWCCFLNSSGKERGQEHFMPVDNRSGYQIETAALARRAYSFKIV